MMDKKLLAFYGLKWNPFQPAVPVEALYKSVRHEHFCWRVENLVKEGGFALLSGDVGMGKSTTFRMLADRLAALRDVVVGVILRPQSGVSDFYRELGCLFGVQLTSSNRWGGFKTLREKWQAHIDATLMRPVLLLDEAQETPSLVLNELRILSATQFDSRSVLTVVLGGDSRLPKKLKGEELLPLDSRIRVRLHLDAPSNEEMEKLLRYSMQQAGNPRLMSGELATIVVERAGGNPRTMFQLASELLDLATQREAKQIDEKLYLDLAQATSARSTRPTPVAGKARVR